MNHMIYVTEDEDNIRELLRCSVESFGYEVKTFKTAEELLDEMRIQMPSLILLDIMLPGMDGISALKLIKKDLSAAEVQIILLTAKSGEVDKVSGLDSGADDYITKPFSVLELSARIRTALRRIDKIHQTPQYLKSRYVIVDTANREVKVNGIFVDLTVKEFELLKILMESGRLMEREELLNCVWGYDYVGESRTLDMHIKTLRSKLGDNVDKPQYIKTVRGIGYRFIG